MSEETYGRVIQIVNQWALDGHIGERGVTREACDAIRAALSLPPDDQMAADARRLDWLERQVRASSYKLLFGMHNDPAIQAGVNRFRVATGIGSGPWAREYESHSIRAAIDAAMKEMP